VPLAATAAVAAAVCAPVVWPLLLAGSGAGAAVAMVISQVGGVGGGLLSEAVIRAWDKLRSSDRPDAGQADLRDALAAELEERLTLGTPAAAALRTEVAGVLREVDAVQVALAATVQGSAAGVREVLVRGLRELGEEFTEFGWVLNEVNQQLTVIAEDVAQTAAISRDVADNQQQTLVELALLRQETRSAFRYRTAPPGPPVPVGVSADEERAAELDAAGVPASAECPYLGLAAFQPSDAGRFFGREQLTAELVARAGEQLARPGLLMVLGPSGSGKSSLLRAGLLPAVAAGALPARGSRAWPRDLMTPGRRPLLELATRIAALAGIPAGALEADLRADPTRIIGASRQALLTNTRRRASTPGLTPAADQVLIDLGADQQTDGPDTGSPAADRRATAGPRLVLIVDQFEEVFTQCSNEQERRTFIRALCAAAGTAGPATTADGAPPGGQVDLRQAPALVVIGIRADFYARSAAFPELVPHLQDDQVLVGPIGEVGLREAIEGPAAVAGLVVDAALVEVLLSDLGLHTSAGAKSEGSNGRAAIMGWDSYPAGRLALLSYALQQTWHNREGRRLTVAGYRATGGIDGAVAQAADDVYDRLDPAGQAAMRRVLLRLVSFGEGTPDTRRRVTLAELAGAGDDERATLTRAALADMIAARLITADAAAAEITHETLLTAWPRLRRWLIEDRAGLRIHRDLTDAAQQWQREGRDPGHLFRGTRLTVARDWAAQHGRDLNDDERAFLATSQHERLRAARLRRSAVAMLAVLTLLSFAAAGVAIQQRGHALTARNQAIASQVTAEAGQLTATNSSLAAELDIAANQISATADTETRLINTATAPLASRLTGPSEGVSSVAYSRDGRTLAAGSYGGTVWLWKLASPAHPTRLGRLPAGPMGEVSSVAFSPDGRILAAGYSNEVLLWNLASPAHPSRLAAGPAKVVNSVAFSADGQTLAAGGVNGRVWLWNLAKPAHPTPLGQLSTSPANVIHSVAFSADGQTLAAGSNDHKVWLWNLANAAHPIPLGRPLTGPTDAVAALAFSRNGRTLAAGGFQDRVWLWNLPATVFTGLTDAVASVAFSPHRQILATGSRGGRVWLWNLAKPGHPTPLASRLTDPMSTVSSVAFSPRGQILAAGSNSGRVWLWNLAKPGHPTPLGRPLTGPETYIDSLAFSRDGRILAAGGVDPPIWLWNLASPARPTRLGRPPADPEGEVDSVAFDPNRQILAAGSYGGPIWLWNLTSPGHPTPLGRPLTGPTSPVNSVAFSPDGKILAAGSNDGVWVWQLASPGRPTPLGRPLNGSTGAVTSVAFSLDGRTLAVGGNDRKVWLWNLASPGRPTSLGPPLTGPTGAVTSVAFSRNGQTLAAGSNDHNVWLWNLNVDDAIQRICAATSNGLTPAQWNQYIPQLPYDSPCAHPGRYGLLGG
jgi:WD40 repeat protein